MLVALGVVDLVLRQDDLQVEPGCRLALDVPLYVPAAADKVEGLAITNIFYGPALRLEVGCGEFQGSAFDSPPIFRGQPNPCPAPFDVFGGSRRPDGLPRGGDPVERIFEPAAPPFLAVLSVAATDDRAIRRTRSRLRY